MTLETIDSGFVTVNGDYLWHERAGTNVQPASEKHLHRMREHIGMVFQQFNLFPHLTAIENVQQPQMLIQKRQRSEARQRAEDLLGLHFSTYTSEVFRAGIENVPRGQWDAARALNYPPVSNVEGRDSAAGYSSDDSTFGQLPDYHVQGDPAAGSNHGGGAFQRREHLHLQSGRRKSSSSTLSARGCRRPQGELLPAQCTHMENRLQVTAVLVERQAIENAWAH